MNAAWSIERRLISIVVLIALGTLARPVTAQTCLEFDTRIGDPTGLSWIGYCMTKWDPDGPGPRPTCLVVGGGFTSAGAVNTPGVACWDGQEWSALSSSLYGVVYSMASWDPDGEGPEPSQLIAGGEFTSIDYVGALNIARFDGAHWHPMGEGMNNRVISLTQWDPDGDGVLPPLVVAGGYFTSAGGTPASRIAAWNGTSWQDIGGCGPDNASTVVGALTVWDADGPGDERAHLYAAGTFAVAGGVSARNIATYQNGGWVPLGSGLGPSGQHVSELTVWDPDGAGEAPSQLVAVGNFSSSGGAFLSTPTARWDGNVWASCDGFLRLASGGAVRSVTTWDPDGDGPLNSRIVAGGQLSSTHASRHILQWDGAAWLPMASGLGNVVDDDDVKAVITFDPDGDGPQSESLFASGDFYVAGTQYVQYFAQWTGTRWIGTGSGIGPVAGPEHGSNPVRVECLHSWQRGDAADEAPTLVAGGAFLNCNFQVANNIAAHVDGDWSTMAEGVIGRILDMCSPGSAWTGPIGRDLFVGGTLTRVGSTNTGGIGSWDGTTWRTLGSGLNGTVTALAAWDRDGTGPLAGEIVAGGAFTASGSTLLNRIAVWNGQNWRALDQGFNGAVGALLAFDFDGSGPQGARLIAAGNFTMSGTRSTPGIARWNGVVWESLGSGIALAGSAVSMLAWDPDAIGPALPQLIVYGDVALAGGVFTNGIARWDGSAWHNMSAGFTGPLRVLTQWRTARGLDAPTRLIAVTEQRLPSPSDGIRVRFFEWQSNAWQEIAIFTTSSDFGHDDTVTSIHAWDDDGDSATPDRLLFAGTIGFTDGRQASNIVEARPCAQTPCVGDLTDDRIIDLTDLAILLWRFGVSGHGQGADFDLDGVVGLSDLAVLLSRFGIACDEP
ncbi:MAG: hypothetical protein ACKVS9_07075 [Phycisphaerae bacterium]